MNKMLTLLFAGRGRCYIKKTGTMQIQYTFEFYLQPFEYAIIQSGILLCPAGVGTSINVVVTNAIFGFAEGQPDSTFGEGVFYTH